MTRRTMLGGLGGLGAAVLLAPIPALALSEGSAEALIDRVVADINRVISSGKSESAMISDFRRLFDRYADNPVIASSVLGQDARRASAAQRAAFSEAFAGYMARKYGKRFREFIGGRVDVQRVRPVSSRYEVDTVVNLRGSAPFLVTFYVSDRSGRPLFYDMSIEGVRLLLSERQEIGAMLDRRGGDINAMIADLQRAG